MESIVNFKNANQDDTIKHNFHFIGGPGRAEKSALFKKLHAACRNNSILIMICTTTSLAALSYEGATTAHSLFLYPVEDEKILTIRTLQDAISTKNVVTFCMRYQSYFGMNLFQMIAFSWKLSWRNSKQDGIHHNIMFLCVPVILLNTGNVYGKDDGGNGPWFVCVFWCVWRDHKKIRKRAKLSMIPRALRKLPLSECMIFWQRGSLKVRYCLCGIKFPFLIR
jgi:hypothetical protein